ncbi:MAG TPA: L-histidine N(alpha)-methyltransferase [Terriglobales bacterium]|jgi:uncharacterized SAM-dependent methyltransferase|nr:L-histidine N(alpha)-methyltransferase [Terriglobales bacterium]
MASNSVPDPAKLPFYTIVLLREQEIVEQLRMAFQQRYLPEHLFYWLPSSVRAWVDLCRSTEYKNASRALEVLNLAAPRLTVELSHIRTLCGLGCGEGSKDLVLLEQFANSGNRLNYVAADFSQSLLELAADQADGIAQSSLGCKLDIFEDGHLAATVGAAESLDGPVLFSVLGNTLGAFEPSKFPRRLRIHMRSQDRFLFDGEIFSEQTLGGYDNPTNRRFAWGPLTGVGITDNDGKLEFSTAPAGDGLFAVTKHFTATRDLRVNVGRHSIDIRSGEKLRMSSSIKYTNRDSLLNLVARAGFRIESQWESRDGQFVLACCAPT